MELIRLQKLIADRGYCSRRKAEELILQGKVKLNGEIVKEMGVKVDKNALIEIEGLEKKENNDALVAYLFNKPTGVLSSVKDDRGRKTVIDYFSELPYRLYPSGRLDYSTSGALIITNDGELSNLITHPSSHLDKTYYARLDKMIDMNDVDKLEKGVLLDDGLTEPSKVQVIKNNVNDVLVKITIHEGRNRQVRRMFEALNYHVKNLHRDSIGFLNVKNIERGKYRQLSNQEILLLKTLCKNKRKDNKIPSYKLNK